MLSKVHLTSHSRMSSPRWVIIPSWLSGSLRSFLYSSLYSCHRFLIPSASLGLYHFCPLLSFPFYCFPLFLCIDHWGRLSYLSLLFIGTLHSDGYIFLFLLCLLLLFFSQLFIRPPQTTFCLFASFFSWRWLWSHPPVPCHEPPSIVLQALCLSDLIPWICLSLPLFNCREFDLGPTWMV